MRHSKLVAVLLMAFVLSGCWSRRELTEVSFAGIMGIDWVDGQYLVTINVLSPRRGGGGGGGSEGVGTNVSGVWTVSQQAAALDEAVGRIDQILSRSLTLAHVRSIIYGEEMARHGIGPTVDYLLRSVEVRPTVWMGVTNGLARDLMTARTRQEGALSEGPLGYHDAAKRRSSVSPSIHLAEMANILQEEGISLTLPVFRLANRETPKPDGEKSPDPEAPKEIIFGGSGVFRDDKLVAWLSPDETMGQLWVKGHIVHGVISAPCKDPDRRAVFRLRKGKGDVKIKLVQGKLVGEVHIKAIADLNELNCREPGLTEEGAVGLSDLLRKKVEQQISAALKVAQKNGADFLGFGQELYRRDPKMFRKHQATWAKELTTMPITIHVDAKVPRQGQMGPRFHWSQTTPPPPP
ncbi:MAG TPA: Ger(x)C family spore germination protein [Symbiobacteriaceae bacterium]|jgi:spore germination protein KC